jgi:hypothetical protein
VTNGARNDASKSSKVAGKGVAKGANNRNKQGEEQSLKTYNDVGIWQPPSGQQLGNRQRQQRQQGNAAMASFAAPGSWTYGGKKSSSCAESSSSSAIRSSNAKVSVGDALSYDELTTLIIRNIPVDHSREMLLQLLNDEGFFGTYDFVHLPIDFQSKAGLGYAIVNMVSHSLALRAQQHFDRFSGWPFSLDKRCEVSWQFQL